VPYHVQHGFAPGESAVTAFVTWGNVWTEGLREHWEDKIRSMLAGIDPFLGTILMLSPIVAAELAAPGPALLGTGRAHHGLRGRLALAALAPRTR